MSFQVAIDGPVAAGKSTVARCVAKELGFTYIDTGAMYRTVTLAAKRQGINLEDEQGLVELIQKSSIVLHAPTSKEMDRRQITVLLNGEDVSWDIREDEISKGASAVAKWPLVRQELVKKQQEIAAQNDVVMEGRDITFRVLPNAQLKIYMDASLQTRAKRLQDQLITRGIDKSLEEISKDIADRDKADMGRAVDPLHIIEGDWVLDTSDLSLDQVIDTIVQKIQSIRGLA